MIKNLLANAGATGDSGLIPRRGRSPEGGYGNQPQYSCLENSVDREAWWATVHRVAKRRTRLCNYAGTQMKFNISNRKNWKIHKIVEIKQCNSIKEITKKIRKYLDMNESENNIPKLTGPRKSSAG